MTREEALELAVRAIEGGACDEAVSLYWQIYPYSDESDEKAVAVLEEKLFELLGVRFDLSTFTLVLDERTEEARIIYNAVSRRDDVTDPDLE